MSVRIYQNITITPHTTLKLDAKACHHLKYVLRAKADDIITLFNGNGGEYTARICEINKKTIHVFIESYVDRDLDPEIKIVLGQGVARAEKMDFIVQKAVELGVKLIVPLITERSQYRVISDKRLLHWQEVAVSACEQSGRNFVPKIASPQSLQSFMNEMLDANKRFILTPHLEVTADKMTLSCEQLANKATVALLIGPEGGFSKEEVMLAKESDFTPITLGPRVLRTETAALTALALIQFCYGDFR